MKQVTFEAGQALLLNCVVSGASIELNRVALSLKEMVLGVTFPQLMLCISSKILRIVLMPACDTAWIYTKHFTTTTSNSKSFSVVICEDG